MRTIITALSLLTLAACGEVDSQYTDAGVFDEAPPPPAQFVVSAMTLPSTSDEAYAIAFDIDGDGYVDNQLGQLFVALRNVTGRDDFATDLALTTAIGDGAIISLLSYQGPGSGSDSAPSLTMYEGAAPVPAPCDPEGICGRHLQGFGSFEIAVGDSRNPPLAGTSLQGPGRESFMGGPGSLVIPFAFAADRPFELPLVGARVDAIGISDVGIDRIVISGAITVGNMRDRFVPELAKALQAQVEVDCLDPGTPPTCGCASGSRGSQWIDLFDRPASPAAPPDCALETAELSANNLIQTAIAPDVTVHGVQATSFSIALTASAATFTR